MSVKGFSKRHIGVHGNSIKKMLECVGVDSLEQLIQETVPENITLLDTMNLPIALTENRSVEHMKAIAQKNKNYRSYIGMGYFNTILPGVIQRNVLEKTCIFLVSLSKTVPLLGFTSLAKARITKEN